MALDTDRELRHTAAWGQTAQAEADDLLASYGSLTGTVAGLRQLLAVAWMRGAQVGSGEGLRAAVEELERALA